MTKKEYVENFSNISYDAWLDRHNKYVDKAIMEMKEYFDIDRFMADYKPFACKTVMLNILADAWESSNYQLGELEDELSRKFSAPFEDMVEYRTDKFWEEIKEE